VARSTGSVHRCCGLPTIGSDRYGWRLARSAWGCGYATEAAIAARDDALGRLGLAELISIIHPENERSQRLASKLGMAREREIYNPVLSRMTDVWRLSTS
jgi:RimJ/RimL family protein N-acetyltransferase